MTRDLFRLFLALTLVSAVACGDDSGSTTGTDPDMGDMAPEDMGAEMITVDMDDPDMPVDDDMGPDMDEPDMEEGMCTDPDGTVGEACFRNSDCNDFCFCNGTELCRGGFCVAGDPPCEDDFECTFRACDEDANTCGDLELRDEVCDDGDICTGMEICDRVLGCVDGIPLNCSDGDSCTVDQCDSEVGCLNPLRDLDGDGFPDSRCTTGLDADCRDDRADINPGATEVCDNFEDDDCDGQADVFDPDCTPTNDVCATAIQLASSGFFGFGTTGLMDDYETQCSSADDEIDAVFFFDVLVESDLTVEITDGPNNAVIELRGPGDLRTCEDDMRASTEMVPCDRSNIPSFGTPFPAEIEANRLAPGRYFLIVETEDEDVGTLDFRLTPSLPPPPTDNCRTAPTIIAPGGVFTENLLLLTDQHDSPSCGSSAAQPEACYILDLATPQDVTISGGFFFASGGSGQGAITVVDDFNDVVMTRTGLRLGLGAGVRAPQPLGRPLLHPRRAHLELRGVPRARGRHRAARGDSGLRPLHQLLHRSASGGRWHAADRGSLAHGPRRADARLRAPRGRSERQLLHLRHHGGERGGGSGARCAERLRLQHRRRERDLPRDHGAHLPVRRDPRRRQHHGDRAGHRHPQPRHSDRRTDRQPHGRNRPLGRCGPLNRTLRF